MLACQVAGQNQNHSYLGKLRGLESDTANSDPAPAPVNFGAERKYSDQAENGSSVNCERMVGREPIVAQIQKEKQCRACTDPNDLFHEKVGLCPVQSRAVNPCQSNSCQAQNHRNQGQIEMPQKTEVSPRPQGAFRFAHG